MSASVWKKSFFSQIGEVIAGGTPSTKISEYWNGDIPFVTPNDLSEQKSPFIHQTERNITKLGLNKSSANLLPKNTLIISTRAPIGYMALSNKECVTNQGCKSIVFDSEQCPLFFYYNAHNYIQKMKLLGSGTTFAEISKSDLEKIVITYPESYVVQQHIADILSTCDTVIQNTQKTIDKYKAIKQGMMQDLFTRGLTKNGKLRPSYKEAPELYKESELGMIPKEWEVKALNEIYSKVTNAFVGTATPYYVESGHFYLESNNVKNGFINFNNKIFINDYFYEKQKNNLLHTGDLVMVQSGHVGHTAVIPEELNNTAAHAVIIIANPKIDASPYFYNYYFFSENAINMISKVTKGNTIKHILSSEMKNFKVCYPKIEEQLAIAKRLSSIDSTIQKEEAILKKYKNIKTGLMARLLTPPEDAEIIDETGE